MQHCSQNYSGNFVYCRLTRVTNYTCNKLHQGSQLSPVTHVSYVYTYCMKQFNLKLQENHFSK